MGKRSSPEAREKRLKNLITYYRRLVKENGLLPTHLMLVHGEYDSVRRSLGQEFKNWLVLRRAQKCLKLDMGGGRQRFKQDQESGQ